MNSTLTSDTPPRELCTRSNDGIEVALLWTPGSEQLRVAVLDLRSNQSFDLRVDGRQAMQVFHHPYAYAAECGLLAAGPETDRNLADPAGVRAEELAP
jgi:hypothetical protein